MGPGPVGGLFVIETQSQFGVEYPKGTVACQGSDGFLAGFSSVGMVRRDGPFVACVEDVRGMSGEVKAAAVKSFTANQ
jgi:hypothetical protein